MKPRPPRARRRVLFGMLILVPALGVYAMLVVQIGYRLIGRPILWQTAFYLAAGLAWLWPARRLLRWMAGAPEKRD